MAKEILAYRLNTIHNLFYYTRLMEELREAIKEDRLDDCVQAFFSKQKPEGG